MSATEIPLLRESSVFAARLIAAVNQFGEPRYHAHRRINWSYRYADRFYAREVDCFKQDANAYLSGLPRHPPELADVYVQRLRSKQVFVVLMKVLAHWTFQWLGRTRTRRVKDLAIQTYRKCYVDDIELVFDPAEAAVVRAVYPFPLNLRRQLRYLAFLRRERLEFKLAGNPYLPADLLRFVIRRDIRSLMRLEARSQLLHANQLVAMGVRTVQLSDEFDIGSLDFTRRLGRYKVHVVNSAHGVGKYLPVHAYHAFHVLTVKQQHYYHGARNCQYSLRRLNDRSVGDTHRAVSRRGDALINLVLLSQRFAGSGDVIAENELALHERLRTEFASNKHITLFYKPHPNSRQPNPPAGFEKLNDLLDVNGNVGTVFVSFFSTSQIDPTFKGRKILVRGRMIFPELAFDDTEQIVTFDGLVQEVNILFAQLEEAKAQRASAAKLNASIDSESSKKESCKL